MNRQIFFYANFIIHISQDLIPNVKSSELFHFPSLLNLSSLSALIKCFSAASLQDLAVYFVHLPIHSADISTRLHLTSGINLIVLPVSALLIFFTGSISVHSGFDPCPADVFRYLSTYCLEYRFFSLIFLRSLTPSEESWTKLVEAVSLARGLQRVENEIVVWFCSGCSAEVTMNERTDDYRDFFAQEDVCTQEVFVKNLSWESFTPWYITGKQRWVCGIIVPFSYPPSACLSGWDSEGQGCLPP